MSSVTENNLPPNPTEVTSTTSEFSEYNDYDSPVVESFLQILNDDAKAMLKDRKVVVLDIAKVNEMAARMKIVNGNAETYKQANEALKNSMDKLLLEVKDIYIAVYPLISMFMKSKSKSTTKNVGKGIKLALENRHLFEKLSFKYTESLLVEKGYIPSSTATNLLENKKITKK